MLMLNDDLIYTAKRIESRNELTLRRFNNASILMLVIFFLSLIILLFISVTNLRENEQNQRMELRENLTGRESILINLNDLNIAETEDEKLIQVRINTEKTEGFLNGILYVSVKNGDIIEFSAPGIKKYIYRVSLE
jgi:hypothetical protein